MAPEPFCFGFPELFALAQSVTARTALALRNIVCADAPMRASAGDPNSQQFNGLGEPDHEAWNENCARYDGVPACHRAGLERKS
jgi:hypothetical protein